MSPSRRRCSGTSCKHSSIIFELPIRLAISAVLKVEIRVFKTARFQLPRFAVHKYRKECFREKLSDEPAEQLRSEQPELPPEEKRSQRSEVTTTRIINQLDSTQCSRRLKQNLLTQKSLICCVNKQLKPVTMSGLAPCPRHFTKLLKPVFSSLRKLGHISVVYVDDTWLTSEDYNSCVNNIAETITLLDRLGFVTQPEKSIWIPTQEITFVGFIFNSANMTVKLTPERALKLKTACLENLEATTPLIRDVARLLGLTNSSFPVVMYGALHYRALELEKTCALKQNKGNFDRPMTLSCEANSDIQWWIDSISETYNPVNHGDPVIIPLMSPCQDGSFSDKVSAKHIKLMVHNTTAVATINQMGTCHSNLNNKLVQQIWEWCILHEVWLTIAHIPGKTNAEADRESRLSGKETEWCLDRSIYNAVIQKLDVIPDIDLFASRLNHQLKPYIAYRPDPGALAVNAFNISWKEYTFYAFPLFSIIQRVLQKINIDQATGIIMVPNWPTQTWLPYLINCPIILPRKTRTLFLPAQPQEIHPLHKKRELLACHLSGTSCLTKEFQKKHQNSSSNPGGQRHSNSVELTLKDGNNSVFQGK
ncbi:hypothetical protein AWC38_SpisGene325 [Stylophora pistillata]|uniref:Reverse transcriptase domain-containing protein n=1 Tax=Stylophora pistillata TaxID=50429 RepID=A0A2B4T203_STYPI|nr:hypothetical protein AWC38_SpisGene325 [Stylophora pistillata]